ncbi:MAG TPA: ATP-binding protein [Pirellulales bacterium]|jgi:two-component system OmpR family sensor kinase|nr:ATP-binding protein [Pirellulales bacterium]
MPVGSLRAKLLVWNAAALLAVTAAFGGLLYVDFRRSIYAEVDRDLAEQSAALVQAVHPESERSFYVELSADQVAHFNQDGPDAPYYAIWDRAGRVVDQSHPLLEVPFPAATGVWDRRGVREHAANGPAASLILVGQGMGVEHGRLRRLLALIVTSGGVVLASTLAIGWFLTGRALAPVARISKAAAAVSESNLSARIDLSAMETELAQLATTINTTFDRLQLAFNRQTQFTADASHELRTPLSIISAQTELALKKERGGEEYREALATIRRSAQRMKSVVEGLLALARADSGTLALQREPLDLARLVEESCAMLGPLAAERGIELVTSLETTIVHVDRERFTEVAENLVSNAIRYNRDGGRVEVSLRENGRHAILEVTDTGVGISDTELMHVFERFYRVDKARSRSVGGSGLGLAITKWIVEAHGGSITVASKVGVGTTFAVNLPRSDGQARP